MPLIAKQLDDDLTLLDKAVDKITDLEGCKRALKEFVEWNRGHVELSGELAKDLSDHEKDIQDILESDGADEGISTESAKILLIALEQSRNVAQTLKAILTSPGNPLDDVSTKQVLGVLKSADHNVGLAMQLVTELVIPDEDDEAPRAAGAEDDDEDDDAEDAELADDEDENEDKSVAEDNRG